MKSVGTAFLIISSIVGAGFASGRELISFFGDGLGFWVVPVVALFVFGTSYLFLMVGNKLNTVSINSNTALFGRFAPVAEFFALLNSFILLAVMLAGTTVISGTMHGVPVVAIIAGIIAVAILKYGINGLMRANLVLIPLLILVLILVCTLSVKYFVWQSNFDILILPKSILYVSLNMYLASGALHQLKLSTKQAIIASTIASIIIGTLLLALMLAIKSNPSSMLEPMPLLYIASKLGGAYKILVSCTLILCIFSSMLIAIHNVVEWLQTIINDRIIAGLIALTCAFIISMLGFQQLVQYLYPIISVVGMVYIGGNVVYLFRNAKCTIHNDDKAF